MKKPEPKRQIYRAQAWLPPSACFASGEFERQFGIHDDLAPDLRNGLVDSAAPLDTIGGRDAASEQFGDSTNAVHVSFLQGENRCGVLLRMFAVLLKVEKFFARHLPEQLRFQISNIHNEIHFELHTRSPAGRSRCKCNSSRCRRRAIVVGAVILR